MAAYRKPLAVVLTAEGVFYDIGRSHPLSARLDLNDIGRVLDGAGQMLRGREGVCMVDIDHTDAMIGLTKRPLPDEWTMAGEGLRAWTTFTHDDGTRVILGLLRELEATDGPGPGPLLEGHQGPADVAWRLGRYHTAMGVPWTFTAGVSGCAAIRAMYTNPAPGSQPLWHHPKTIRGLRSVGPLIWQAEDQPAAGDHLSQVVALDVNAMYLAGLKNARMAWGQLTEHGSIPFDPDWPGYWELDAADIPTDLYDGVARPPLFSARMIHQGGVWLSTPVVKRITELAGCPAILNSMISENGHPIGRMFAERMIAARSGDLGPIGPIRPALKRTYAELVGMMAREGGSIHRVDWSAAVMDLSRMNMDRRTAKLGDRGRIIRVQTDAVYVLSQSLMARQEISAALGVGTGPGLFKFQEQLTVDEYRAKFRMPS